LQLQHGQTTAIKFPRCLAYLPPFAPFLLSPPPLLRPHVVPNAVSESFQFYFRLLPEGSQLGDTPAVATVATSGEFQVQDEQIKNEVQEALLSENKAALSLLENKVTELNEVITELRNEVQKHQDVHRMSMEDLVVERKSKDEAHAEVARLKLEITDIQMGAAEDKTALKKMITCNSEVEARCTELEAANGMLETRLSHEKNLLKEMLEKFSGPFQRMGEAYGAMKHIYQQSDVDDERSAKRLRVAEKPCEAETELPGDDGATEYDTRTRDNYISNDVDVVMQDAKEEEVQAQSEEQTQLATPGLTVQSKTVARTPMNSEKATQEHSTCYEVLKEDNDLTQTNEEAYTDGVVPTPEQTAGKVGWPLTGISVVSQASAGMGSQTSLARSMKIPSQPRSQPKADEAPAADLTGMQESMEIEGF